MTAFSVLVKFQFVENFLNFPVRKNVPSSAKMLDKGFISYDVY